MVYVSIVKYSIVCYVIEVSSTEARLWRLSAEHCAKLTPGALSALERMVGKQRPLFPKRVLATGVFGIVEICLGLMRKIVFRNH